MHLVRHGPAHIAENVVERIKPDDPAHDVEHRLQTGVFPLDAQRGVVVLDAFEAAGLKRILECAYGQLAAERPARRGVIGDPGTAPEDDRLGFEISDACNRDCLDRIDVPSHGDGTT